MSKQLYISIYLIYSWEICVSQDLQTRDHTYYIYSFSHKDNFVDILSMGTRKDETQPFVFISIFCNSVIGPKQVGCRPEIVYGHAFVCHIKTFFSVNVTTFAPNWQARDWVPVQIQIQKRDINYIYYKEIVIFSSQMILNCHNNVEACHSSFLKDKIMPIIISIGL